MKSLKGKIFAVAAAAALAVSAAVGLAGCGGSDTTTNTLFLYPVNYYGIEGKAFTSRWNGMKAALEDAGWQITGDGQQDSKQFKAARTDECEMPEDTKIVFVNNQTWDTNLALTDKLLEYQPLAVITTCNGVEFCSERIVANSPDTQNATMASFSESYKQAFEDGTLHYMASKYSASVAPVVAAVYSAVTTGERMVDSKGEPLHLTQSYWTIDSYEKYCEMEQYDIITGSTPTIMKADMDACLGDYDKFAEFVEDYTSTFDGVKSLVEKHEAQNTTDTKATTSKFKLGLLVPNSINDSVQAYLDFIEGYLADVYNYETQRFYVSGSTNQETAAEQACNAGCKAIISLQDDTNRQAACEKANSNKVWFAVAGACVYGTSEWQGMAACDYYVGSIGTSLDDEYQAGYDMVKKYIDIINERGAVS
ncbi:MAG: hypothetical protein ACI4MH_06870 [Candidatus Coproplasma sp.]